MRIPTPGLVEYGGIGELDGVPRAAWGDTPAVQDDQRDKLQAASAPARQIASNEARSSDAPPTSAPSTSGSSSSRAALSGFTDPPYRTDVSWSDLTKAGASCPIPGARVF